MSKREKHNSEEHSDVVINREKSRRSYMLEAPGTEKKGYTSVLRAPTR